MRRINLVGKKFGRLTVLSSTELFNNHGQLFWTCRCRCGRIKEVLGCNLRSGNSKSCGCLSLEISKAKFKLVDRKGLKNGRSQQAQRREGSNYISSKDKWYKLCAGRYYWAIKNKIPVGFSSAHEFATYCKSIAPLTCPVFGKPLGFQKQGFDWWSYSVDRKIPIFGYTRGNVQIISMKANRLKGDMNPDDLNKFAKWVLSCG